jgi:hypothetical protein
MAGQAEFVTNWALKARQPDTMTEREAVSRGFASDVPSLAD